MTTFAHAGSGSIATILLLGIQPQEHFLQAVAVLSATILDLDHLYFFLKDKNAMIPGNMHKARSVLHELIGFIIIGIIMLGLSFFDFKLALLVGMPMMIHLTEDLIMGISIPFNPIDKMEMKLLPQKKKLKIIIDLLVLLISGYLWIIFLNGQI